MEAKLGLANIFRRSNLNLSDKTVEPLQLYPQTGIEFVKAGHNVEKKFKEDVMFWLDLLKPTQNFLHFYLNNYFNFHVFWQF